MNLFGDDEEGDGVDVAVENLSGRVEDLESHLSALDDAVGDLRGEFDGVSEGVELEFEIVEENRGRIVELEGLLKQLSDVSRSSLKEIESNRSRFSRRVSELESRLDSLESEVGVVKSNQSSIESLLERLEDKILGVEEELTDEVQLNQARIDSKVSEQGFEEELSELRDEFSRVKASVNALADELDEDGEDIRIE